MPRFVKLWPAALSAVLVLCAFPPINLGLLALVGLAPLLATLMKGGAKRSLALGYTFGLIYMLAQMAWLDVLVNRWTSNPPLAVFTWLLTGFLGAWYFALFGWLANRCFQRGWPWMVPLVWAGIEVFRSYIPGLAFPWGLLADPLWPMPSIIQEAYFGSIYLLSAWCVLISMVVALWLGGANWKVLRQYGMAAAFLLVLSLARYSTPIPGHKMTVVAGQLGVDMAFGDADKRKTDIVEAVKRLELAGMAQHANLLVLPEGTADVDQVPPTLDFPISPTLPILFGAQRGTGPVYQSAISYDGSKWQYADKTRLVIFGEYVPFRKVFPFLANYHLAGGDLTPGDHPGVVDVNGTKIGPLVCFEGLFPDLSFRQAQNGAQLLAVISIDDWYMGTPAPDQLRSAAVWRAVETGLPLVRSASLGYSLAVDANGRMITEAPVGQLFPLHAELQVPDSPQPFPFFPAFPLLGIASMIAAFLIPWLPKSKEIPDVRRGSQTRRGRRANDSG